MFRVLRSALPGVFRPPVSWAGLLTLALVIENAYLAVPVVAHRWVLRLEESDAARGRRLAETFGCVNCHGPDGRGEVPNPGSRYDSVPAFSGQTLMMFVKNDRELREYILDGAPARRLRDPGYRA
ncbi:MAG: c-type cytochrome, partial [Deltaproteobacteria bacterium]